MSRGQRNTLTAIEVNPQIYKYAKKFDDGFLLHYSLPMADHSAEGIFALKKTPGLGKCPVKGCRNPSGKKKASLCDKHYQYRWRMKTPKRSAYSTLRDHAVGRGIKFTISYDYFLGVTDAFGYWEFEVTELKEQPSIDRRDPTKGYEPGNLVVLTISENSIKGNRERFLPANVQHYLEKKRKRMQGDPIPEEDPDRNPF